MRKYFNTQFDIGDAVWTVELGSHSGRYHVCKRYVEYFKLVTGDVLYGFTYNIEVSKCQCFHTEEMAEHCAEVWNKKLEKIEEQHNSENKDLEDAYYDAVYDCLGSKTEKMYELGYDPIDIAEQEKCEKYLSEKADVLEELCERRGIKLWE